MSEAPNSRRDFLIRGGLAVAGLTLSSICSGCWKSDKVYWGYEDQRLIQRAEANYDPKKLKESLERILAWLKANNPVVASALLPGLSEKEIREKTKDLGYEPPQELLILYQWRNGTPDDFDAPFIWYHTFGRLERALKDRKTMLAKASDTSWDKSWFPIFDFQGEEYFVSCAKEPTTARPVRYYFIEETATYPCYINLTTMMETAAAIYESGAVKVVNEQGAIKGDIEQIKEIHHKYNPGMLFPYNVPVK